MALSAAANCVNLCHAGPPTTAIPVALNNANQSSATHVAILCRVGMTPTNTSLANPVFLPLPSVPPAYNVNINQLNQAVHVVPSIAGQATQYLYNQQLLHVTNASPTPPTMTYALAQQMASMCNASAMQQLRPSPPAPPVVQTA